VGLGTCQPTDLGLVPTPHCYSPINQIWISVGRVKYGKCCGGHVMKFCENKKMENGNREKRNSKSKMEM
jgi:hypothetical protein